MSAPLKIFSLLIRGLDAELRARAIKEGKHIQEEEDSEEDNPGFMHQNDDQDCRLETYQGDSDESGHDSDYEAQYGDKIKVDMIPVNNGGDDDAGDIEKRFDV